jgi:hypothetical protein
MTYGEFEQTIKELAIASGAPVPKDERISIYYERFKSVDISSWRRVIEQVSISVKSYKDIPAISEIAGVVTSQQAWGKGGYISDMMVFDCECLNSFAFSRRSAQSSYGQSIRCPGHFYNSCNRLYPGEFLLKNSTEAR